MVCGCIPLPMSIVEFSCLFCNTKISEFFDMAKSWATFCCSNGKSEDYCKLCIKTTQLYQTFALDNSKCFIHFYII